MASPSQALDHLVLFLPVDTDANLPKIPPFFQNNFRLSPGGFHADGASSNTLILLADGCYIELISFVKPEVAPSHWWGPDSNFVGWKDWCLTNDSTPEENNERVKETHGEPIRGGRKRADGLDVKWAVTFPKGEKGGQHDRGRLPFFCHDVTARHVRVPIDEETTKHPSGVLGVRQLTVIVKDQALLDQTRRSYASILGNEGVATGDEISFQAGRVNQVPGLDGGPTISLRLAKSEEEIEQIKAARFVYGNVVLAAKAGSGKTPGTLERIDSAADDLSVGGLWIEYV